MTFSFSFEKMAHYDSGASGITVSVCLKLGQNSIDCEAKIDTGATYCIFSRTLGEQLGIDIESGTRQFISTVIGSFTTYRHTVTLNVLGYEFDVMVCFAADESFQRNVLGRHGFLDQVKLGLVDYDGELYLSRYEGE